MNYKTIFQDGIAEEEIKKSRFICQLRRIETEEEGREFIAQIKKEHYKASHSCSAMIIGEDSSIKRSSDDGEPSGTAGVPMLTVLEKQGLTNVVAVVTRYFGGTKLGAGGLIRAYAGSVSHALKEIGIVEVKEQTGLKVTLTYPQYQTFANFLSQENLLEQEPLFLEEVTSTIYVDPEKVEGTLASLTEFYQGKVRVEEAGSQIVELPLTLETSEEN
ncbi:YigZ family protein [Streptococcus loxodontisalivarius]|uniref:YigZ family protein n=1 Tax=Streptococcus loxodontisalivarius TaxID=1349415 RepID=A0ABS2PQ89_9STRE|nr:YigZ family protein [Streptococcus loxodontisalivarius]MBM7642213.1 putative YigZ family protein [Streptococcus loxodontisalivarius]